MFVGHAIQRSNYFSIIKALLHFVNEMDIIFEPNKKASYPF